MNVKYTAAGVNDSTLWITHNLGWNVVQGDDYDALVVTPKWPTYWSDTKEVMKATWAMKPVYRVSRINDGYRLEHLVVSEDALANIHSAHARGYAIQASA